jgi:hypothetical protein
MSDEHAAGGAASGRHESGGGLRRRAARARADPAEPPGVRPGARASNHAERESRMSPTLGSSTIKAGRPAPDESRVWVAGGPVDPEACKIATASEQAADDDEDDERDGTP